MYVINDNEDYQVSVLPYMKEHKVLKKLLEKHTSQELDLYFSFIYLILDPRSPYFVISDNIKVAITNVINDFPEYESYLDTPTYVTLFEFVKRFQDTNLRKEIKSLREEIEVWNTIYRNSMDQMNIVTNKDSVAVVNGLIQMKQNIAKAEIELSAMIAKAKEVAEDVAFKVRANESLSIIEQSYIKRPKDKTKRKQ